MHDIKVLGHIKTVRATRIDLMTAVIHGKSHKNIVVLPVFTDEGVERAVGGIVETQLTECFGTFGSKLMHDGIVVPRVDSDEIMFILDDKASDNSVELFDRGTRVVVKLSFGKDLREGTSVCRYDCNTLPCFQEGIKDRFAGEDGTLIFLNAMLLWREPRIHRSKIYGRDSRLLGTQGQCDIGAGDSRF